MKNIIEYLNHFQPYIIMALIAVVLILFIMLIVTLKCINKLEARYRRVTRGVNNKNLEEIIVSYLDHIDSFKEEEEKMRAEQNEFLNQLKKCLQKVSIKRYKAFDDVGSDLSFSIALLDDNNDGIILTGIYGRQDSTVYAKPIDQGISRYDLSEEEEEVLIEACNSIQN